MNPLFSLGQSGELMMSLGGWTMSGLVKLLGGQQRPSWESPLDHGGGRRRAMVQYHRHFALRHHCLQHPQSWPATGVPTQFSKAMRENCFGAPTHLHPLVQPSCLTEDLLFVQLFSYPPFPVHLPSSGPLSFLVWIIIVVLSLVIRVLSPR